MTVLLLEYSSCAPLAMKLEAPHPFESFLFLTLDTVPSTTFSCEAERSVDKLLTIANVALRYGHDYILLLVGTI